MTEHDDVDPDGPPRLMHPGYTYLIAVEWDRVTGEWCPTCSLPSAWRVRFLIADAVACRSMYRVIAWGCAETDQQHQAETCVDGCEDARFWHPGVHRPHPS